MHEACIEKLIPNGISPEHDYTTHLPTGGAYANALNAVGLEDVSGAEIREAIFKAAKWDQKSKWPGHPHPNLVIEELRKK